MGLEVGVAEVLLYLGSERGLLWDREHTGHGVGEALDFRHGRIANWTEGRVEEPRPDGQVPLHCARELVVVFTAVRESSL